MHLDISKFVEVMDGSLVFNADRLERTYLHPESSKRVVLVFISGDTKEYVFDNKEERDIFWNHLKGGLKA